MCELPKSTEVIYWQLIKAKIDEWSEGALGLCKKIIYILINVSENAAEQVTFRADCFL